jgi:hypothetical protein
MRVPGCVAALCAGALIGCGDGSLTSPPDAGTGIVLTQPPPFSIPTAPAAADLRLCDANTAWPWAIGFLSDGRAVVGVRVDRGGVGATLVAAWDPRTNALDNLFVSPARQPSSKETIGPLVVSTDGKRIFEILATESYRVYDVAAAALLSNQSIPIDVTAISGDGNFVLDAGLRTHAADSTPAVDFGALVPGDVRLPGFPLLEALSFNGEAVALGAFDPSNASVTIVVHADGRVARLPDSPGTLGCSYGCGLDWSADGHHLVQFSSGGLRVWDLTTGQLTARSDESFRHALFLAGGDRIVTVDEQNNLVERDLTLGARFATTIDDATTAVGPDGKILGEGSSGFAVLDHGTALGIWPRFGVDDWLGAVGVRDTDSFMLVSGGSETSATGTVLYPVRLERYAHGAAGPVAVFRSQTGQSEWRGDVALSPDQSRLAVVFPDTVAVLDPTTLAPVARIATSAGTIVWSPDGRYVATTPDLHYRDNGRATDLPAPEIAVWEAMTGNVARRFAVPAYANRVAFDKVGSRLVGWGPPLLQILKPVDGGAASRPFPVTAFTFSGDPISFEIDLLTGRVSTVALPPFVGATRELVATPSQIMAVSTGQAVATLTSPFIRAGAFSGDFSLLLALDDLEATGMTNTDLISVATGHVVASLPTFWGSYLPALAASNNGRRIQLDNEIYCLVDAP